MYLLQAEYHRQNGRTWQQIELEIVVYDIEKLLDDFGIANTGAGKHSRPGWVQIECPLCTGNPGWHGGFNLTQAYYNCWRCGWHTIEKVLAAITSQNPAQLKKLLRTYTTYDIDDDQPEEDQPVIHRVEMPLGTDVLQEQHKTYLHSRGLDAQRIEQEWSLLGTGPFGDYKFRIIAPIHYQNRIISYQGRDITNRSSLPYKACPKSHEIIHHKHVIYGMDKVALDRMLLVEGIADVWNVGPGTGATFGIDYTRQQELILHRYEGIIFIMFDAEEEKAQEQAEFLVWQLHDNKADVVVLDYGDPGELSPNEVVSLRKELGI
jgi:hypothetical protein